MNKTSAISGLLFIIGCASGSPTTTEPARTSAPSVATAAADPGCENSCGMSGDCSMKDGKCVATEEGCRLSGVCITGGMCVAKDGACVATEETCKTLCPENGNCQLSETLCTATADGCKNSAACKRTGECVLEDSVCTVDEASCKASENCASKKECRVVDTAGIKMCGE